MYRGFIYVTMPDFEEVKAELIENGIHYGDIRTERDPNDMMIYSESVADFVEIYGDRWVIRGHKV